MTHTVDEESWSAVDATAYSTHEILAHSIRIRMLSESTLDLRSGNAQRRRVLGERSIIERVLVRIKHIVHLPELVVRARCLRNLSRVLGIRMHFGQRKI